MMETSHVVTREEWNSARKALLAKETDGTHSAEFLAEERRKLPLTEMTERYVFQGPDAPSELIDLFDGADQLVIYHFMFHPDWDSGCPHCTQFIDQLDDLEPLRSASTRLVLVSRAPLEKLAAYSRARGWTLPWYSSSATTFNVDFGVTVDDEEIPGQSIFVRDGDRVYLAYTATAFGGEIATSAADLIALTPFARNLELQGS